MSTGNLRFNAAAAGWDSNPNVQKASSLAYDAILRYFPNAHNFDVLEIGCGTGVLSLKIAAHVHSLTAVDSAEGMIEVLKDKLFQTPEVKNILPVHALLEDPDDPRIRPDPTRAGIEEVEKLAPRRFDLILSHLVLHHISDLPAVFRTMFGCLKAGSSIALTDFEDFGPEARRFHPEAKMDGVERHGIPRKEVEMMLKDAGFVDVKVETAFRMEKGIETVPGEGVKGETMEFPFLICMGRKL
ncbi:S-adenosyl-L-methionine-dependent methyltransferase [Venustampulla echinocandica]|uniref:S-adenosyl-L-methionine-dependent methyltransferase n=1 Tax=Venustampulla echinocandica TaxID=2656787 RepID=A0A370TWJ6_9HELO|nr:S-adenosyl-L-methionine-dependent methyltransferase [Venustampulla echinocandica]RDL39897.1 S-adenosyl-L-methionine-dependent methyltransferase [Venustampulla echinocandica]